MSIVRSDGSRSLGRTIRAEEVAVPLRSCDLTYIRITHEARLQFEDIEVVIACPFSLTIDGVAHALDPENRGELGPLLRLFPSRLETVSVEPNATLRLVFENDAILAIPPDEHYEAWEIFGPGDYSIECAPGSADPDEGPADWQLTASAEGVQLTRSWSSADQEVAALAPNDRPNRA